MEKIEGQGPPRGKGSMKIGFDISQTGRLKAGCGYFADSLIRNLAEIDRENDYILYPTFGNLFWDPHWSSDICRIDKPNFGHGLGHKNHEAINLFWSDPAANFETHLGNPDIIHSNNFYCPLGLKKARLLYTLYDLSFLIHPKWTTEQNRTGCFKGVFNASIYADFIISISHYSRRHFLEVFPHYPPDRIVVVHPASRFLEATDIAPPPKASFLKKDQFWLSVGVLEPRKNHNGLLKAFAQYKADHGKTFPLILAGGEGWLMEDFKKIIKDLNLQQDVILLGYVDDGTLQWLYQNCFAFLYPSFFEGFGLPVLEAMSLGTPVIASNAASLTEIVEQAGVLIDPKSEKEMLQAMNYIGDSPEFRISLKEKAFRQAGKFSWRSAAAAVLQTYQEALSRERIFSLNPSG